MRASGFAVGGPDPTHSGPMLILSRKAGDAILIDGGIRIVVLACDSGGVRLGIDAPSEIGIVREEVIQRIAEETRRAGATPEDRDFLERLTRKRSGRRSPDASGASDEDPSGP